MGVCASVSSTLSFGLVGGGHAGMVFGWLIPGFFVVPVSLCLAELCSCGYSQSCAQTEHELTMQFPFSSDANEWRSTLFPSFSLDAVS